MTTINVGGYTMFIQDELIVSRMIKDNGFNYEIHVRRQLERLLPNAAVFWDIGANIGIHTVSAKQINPKLQIFCFEPGHLNQSLLLKTLGANGWTDVTVIPVALLGKCGMMGINDCKDNPCVGEHGPAYNNWVPVMTLDSFDIPMPNVVKIDIEGCELDAFRAAKKLMAAKPVIISEYNLPLLDAKGQGADYADFLIEHGYKVSSLEFQKGMGRTISSGKELREWVLKTSGCNTDIIAEPK